MSLTKTIFFCRLRGHGRLSSVHRYGWCPPEGGRVSPGPRPAQHRHFQIHHPPARKVLPEHAAADRQQPRRHIDLRGVEAQRAAEAPSSGLRDQPGFVQVPVSDVAEVGDRADELSRVDYW